MHLRRYSLGLIPAGAGNICRWRVAAVLVGAHPRGCGEHDRKRFLKMFEEGSSPRVRGTLLALFGWGDGDGLIPAGAGNIPHTPYFPAIPGAHPRGCGEHMKCTSLGSDG